jgi:hypothetical protein
MDSVELERLLKDLHAAMPTLPVELVGEAIQAISAIDDDAGRDRALAALAVRLIALDQGWTALDVIDAITDRTLRARTLVAGARALEARRPGGDEVAGHMRASAGQMRAADPRLADMLDVLDLSPQGASLHAGSLGRPAVRTDSRPGPAMSPSPVKFALSTGFAPRAHAHDALPPDQPLVCDGSYYFWLTIEGEHAPRPMHAIDVGAVTLPIEHLADDASLTVTLVSEHGELAVTPGHDVGKLHVMPEGHVEVTHQPAGATFDPGLAKSRLLFPVRAPERAGRAQLRCNIKIGDTLVQSWLITAQVAEPGLAHAMRGALRAELDSSLRGRILDSSSPRRPEARTDSRPGQAPSPPAVHDTKSIPPLVTTDPQALLRALLDHVQGPAPRRPGLALPSGFAPGARPHDALPPDQPLACGASYYFWLAIEGEHEQRAMNAIDAIAATLPIEHLPEDARLAVALFSVHGELAVTPGQDIGELHVLPDGRVEVTRQPAGAAIDPIDPIVPIDPIDPGLASNRLFFPVRAPASPGTARLRCNIYYRDTLVQSRLITAQVAEPGSLGAAMMGKALHATIDYQLAHSLRPEALSPITSHTLSVLMGREREGTHTFRFFGASQFKSEAVLDELDLLDLINRAREALRKVAWGSPESWTKEQGYRYASPAPLAQLGRDLIELAISGYRLYDVLINGLAGDYDAAENLAAIMRAPGQVQIALQRSPRAVVPMALIYDHPLDTNARQGEYALCRHAADALEREQSLASTACFAQSCPSHGDPLVVCPSGFWGYRHALGMPLDSKGASPPPVEIRYGQGLKLSMAVSTDPAFTQRAGHEQRLRELRPGLEWSYADSREDALRLLRESEPHLVYFYCHGGMANRIPYLQVGPRSERGITRENLRLHRIRWERTRPLVFLNGCHTTALSPDEAMELVSAFVENTAACGVIGTEITVFEPLACAFAEAFYGHLLAGLSVGEAVRAARLSLLEARNPLGLVYVPYVLASARLQREHGHSG